MKHSRHSHIMCRSKVKS